MPKFSFTFSGDSLDDIYDSMTDFLDNSEEETNGAPATLDAGAVKDAIADAKGAAYTGKKRGRKPKVDAPPPINPPPAAVAAAAPQALAAALAAGGATPGAGPWLAPGSLEPQTSPFAPAPLGPPATAVSSAVSPFGAPPLGQPAAPAPLSPVAQAAHNAVVALITKHGAGAVMPWLSKSLGQDFGTDSQAFLTNVLPTLEMKILTSLAQQAV